MDENKTFPTNGDTEASSVTDTETTENEAVAADIAADTAETAAEEMTETAENAVEETTETAETAAEETTDTAEDAVGETTDSLTEPAQAAVVQKPAKKKRVLQGSIIISLVIVALTAVALLVFMLFFNNTITGGWHYLRHIQVSENPSDDDFDADYYFEFNSDGTVSYTIGTVTSRGTYSITNDEDGNTVFTCDLVDSASYSPMFYGKYTYEITGNAFSGRTLTLKSTEYDQLQFEMTSGGYTAPELKHEQEFKPNDALIGTWVYEQDGYVLTYESNADGTACYSEKVSTVNPYTGMMQNIDVSINGIYDLSKDKITLLYYFAKTDKPGKMEINYSLDGNTLEINNLKFQKQDPASVDQK